MKAGVNILNFGPGAGPEALLGWAQVAEAIADWPVTRFGPVVNGDKMRKYVREGPLRKVIRMGERGARAHLRMCVLVCA